jgi:hypothetical protein
MYGYNNPYAQTSKNNEHVLEDLSAAVYITNPVNTFFRNKNISKMLKLKLKKTIIDKTLNICIRN